MKKNQMIHQMISLSPNHVIWRRVIRRNLYLDNGIRAIEGADIGEDHYTLPRLIYYANSVARVNKTIYHYNCMNCNSYMREGMACRFDAGRYHSDNFSIDVLRDFFKEKDENVFQELNRIKIEHSFDSLWGVLKAGNKKAFRSVCIDMLAVEEYADSIGTTPSHLRRISNHYFFYWLLVRIKIVVKKITGVKKYYI